MQVGEALLLIGTEFDRAVRLHPGVFVNPHHGFAVLLEEVNSLWDEVRKNGTERDPKALQREAIHIGAMAVRFLVDLCVAPEEGPDHAA